MTIRVSVDIESLRPQEWTTRAACNPYDAEMWWALPGSAEQDLAKSICHHDFPVRAECLAAAEKRGETDGIWGGLDPYERYQLRRGQPVAAPPPIVAPVRNQRRQVAAALAASGWTDRQIAARLNILPDSVRCLRRRNHIPSGKTVRERTAA